MTRERHFYEVRKTATYTLLVEAISPEEAEVKADATPIYLWDELETETSYTSQEVEVPF